jgi:hypothetical protein
MDVRKKREEILKAAETSVDELIKVLRDPIIGNSSLEDNGKSDLTADKMKNAAASKKLAFMDALEILSRIESERNIMDGVVQETHHMANFAESRATKPGR